METATYVYCLLQSGAPPPLDGVPDGLEGASRPRALQAGEALWLVVADAPLSRYGAEAIDRGLRDLDWVSRCALAHEAVVEHHLGTGTLVPMKLFTLFSTDERAVADVQARRAAVDAVLREVEGREEWGLRLLLDKERALGRLREGTPAPSSGTAFLLRKKEERDAGRRLADEAARRAQAIYADLAGRAARARHTPAPAEGAGRLVLDAAFLVAVAARDDFRAAAREHARAAAGEGLDLVLTGPWPAYNFVGEGA